MIESLSAEEREYLLHKLKEVVPQLTKRQLECFALWALGFNQADVGFILGINQRTVSDCVTIIWNRIIKNQ